MAFSFVRPVLLTIGAGNVAPYARQSRQSGIALAVRVLPRADSVEACLKAGVPQSFIIAAKGPFSVEENQRNIRQYGIGVLVTKDSGEAGGVAAKLEAARREKCQVIVVGRPELPVGRPHSSVEDLVKDVLQPVR